MTSQNHLHHGVAGQCAVQVVQLLAAGCGDCKGDTQVSTLAAGAQFDMRGVKSWVKPKGYFRHGLCKAIALQTHNFDGELAWVLDQAVCVRRSVSANDGQG